MSYTTKTTYEGAQPVHGFMVTKADLDVSGTAPAGTGISVDLSTYGPSDGTTYEAPLKVELFPRDEPTTGYENVEIHWDKDNDSTANGTVRIQIDDKGLAANGLANLEVRVLCYFIMTTSGGIG
jgi:hypothetical protein